MRFNNLIFIFSLLLILSLIGCSDNSNDPKLTTAEHSLKNADKEKSSVITNIEVAHESSRQVSTNTALSKNVADKIEGHKKIIGEKVVPEKRNKNPFLAIQFKREKDVDDQHYNVEDPITKAANVDSSSLYSAATGQGNKQQPIQSLIIALDENATKPVLYVCPMHPSVVSDHKDNCPVCGMHLVKQEKQRDLMDESNTVRLSSGVVQKIGVRTTAVIRGSLRKSLKTAGNVGYNEKRLTHVISQTYGWVENLSLRRAGLPVKRGELLMEIYAPEYLKVQKEFLRTQKLDKSAGQLKKYAERDETIPSREYLRYLQIPESAINELTRSGKTRLRIPVYAPQYGEVVQLNVKKHSYVNAGQPMLTIADFSSVWVEVNVFQHQLEWLRRNQEAEIVVDVLPGQRLKGRVDAIDPELDPRTHTVKVRILVANPDDVLRPNMYAQVTIFDNAQKDILKIPREALIETGHRTSVIKALGDGVFMPVDVIAGLHNGGEVEIKSGLQEGDLVVTSGQFLIDSEANLRASFRRLGHAHKMMPTEHDEALHIDGKE